MDKETLIRITEELHQGAFDAKSLLPDHAAVSEEPT